MRSSPRAVSMAALLLGATMSGGFFSKPGSKPTSKQQDKAAFERDQKRLDELDEMEKSGSDSSKSKSKSKST